jgi:hypothetical protein
MKTLTVGLRILLTASLLALSPGWTLAEESKQTFSQSELDQMMAPIALYPDSLLSQILMASTCPADVAEAVKWSNDNPDQKGDAAVTAVQEKSWDPSVMSLVAFPQVLDMMGKQPDWVQNVGDAFLADPDGVMDTAQELRKKAKDEGNLETTKEQTVTVEGTSSESIIVIQPADPKVVYVPVYNPTVVYGTWWWPSYRPYYYYPVGYGFGSAVVRGIGFGIGIGITNALWGGCNWRNNSVNINVNRFNNVNVNRNRLNVNNRNTNWNHNSNNRKGVPYRDKGSRDKFSKNIGGADKRKDFRGRDAERAKAQSALKDRGIDPAKGRKQLSGAGGDRTRDSVNKANRDIASGKLANRGDKGPGGAAGVRDGAAAKASQRGGDRTVGKTRDRGSSGNAALKGVGNAGKSNRSINRGTSSSRAARSAGGRAGGGMRAGGGHRGR